MITWVLFLGIGLVVGVIAGFYFARLENFSNSQKKTLQQKLDFAQQQLNDYKSQVSEHFLQTASLVNSMTESYKAVHAHLAGGARELCDSQFTGMQLEMPTTESVENTSLAAQEKSASATQGKDNKEVEATTQLTEASAEQSVEQPAAEPVSPVSDAKMSAEQSGEETSETKQPPSSRESVHVVENDSTSPSSLSDADHNASASTSRMVH